jgi:hypothetical protein
MMAKGIFVFLNFFMIASSFGQQEYAKTILDSLCHERYDGRGYVNNGDVRAADFIARELVKLGASPVKNYSFEQPYSMRVNTFPSEMLVILGEDTLMPGKDYLVDPNSGTVKGKFELVEINSANIQPVYNGDVQLNQYTTSQKIFAFNFTDIQDKEHLSKLKGMAVKAMGYVPVIWVEKNKQMFSVGRKSFAFPLINIDFASYFKVSSVELDIVNKFIPNYQAKNIIGKIDGKKKNKFIVFSAHYDHLGRMGSNTYFPGANDNASGVAMLLSLAKYFKQHPPKYSIVFCFFSGEEAGLEGSKYFVSNPYFKLNQIKFVLNIDIMGSADNGVTIVNATKHINDFTALVNINSEKGYLKEIKSRGPTANSDHYYFSELGVPAFFIYSMGSVRNYHDIYDSAENTPLTKFNEVQSLMIDFVATK